jgi:hypothetical protein
VFGEQLKPQGAPKKTVQGSHRRCIKFDSGEGYLFGLKREVRNAVQGDVIMRFPGLVLLFFASATAVFAAPQTTTPAPQASQQSANVNGVDSIIALVQANMSEGLVLKTIQRQNKAYDLTPDDLLKLQKAGVSERIINAMLDPSTISGVNPAAPAGPPAAAAPPVTAAPAAAPAAPRTAAGPGAANPGASNLAASGAAGPGAASKGAPG